MNYHTKPHVYVENVTSKFSTLAVPTEIRYEINELLPKIISLAFHLVLRWKNDNTDLVTDILYNQLEWDYSKFSKARLKEYLRAVTKILYSLDMCKVVEARRYRFNILQMKFMGKEQYVLTARKYI